MHNFLNNLLFKPSTLSQYRHTKLYKVLAYLFLLGFLSVLVMFIDFARFSGFSQSDMPLVESVTNVRFSHLAEQLPDCTLENGELTCPDDNYYEIGDFENFFVVVVDPSNQLAQKNHQLTKWVIAYTSDGLMLHNRFVSIPFDYEFLPEAWQSFNFVDIKAADKPGISLYTFIVGGINEIYRSMLPFFLIGIVLFGFISILIETLLVSAIFYLFLRRDGLRYGELFRITTFAQTLAVLLALIFRLIGMALLPGFFLSLITFIYIYRGISTIPRQKY